MTLIGCNYHDMSRWGTIKGIALLKNTVKKDYDIFSW